MSRMRRLLPWALAAAACADDEVPERPTWADHVRPILMSYCVRCHGETPSGGAPDGFRLDLYETSTAPGQAEARQGAAVMAEYIVERAVHVGDMPPNDIELTAAQRETLRRWYEDLGAPEGEANAAPSLADVRVEGERIIYVVEDPDYGSLLLGEVRAEPGGYLVAGDVHVGAGTLVLDTGPIPAGTYDLIWTLDDGLLDAPVQVTRGQVVVSHADGNVAPSLSFSRPIAGTRFHDSDPPSLVEIELIVTDPDVADVVTVDLVAFRGDQEIVVAENLPAPAGSVLYDWDIRRVPAATNWRLRATASDGKATRTAVSDYFTVSHATTRETCESVFAQVITPACLDCHRRGGLAPTVELFEGVGDCAAIAASPALFYRRVVELRDMPPPSARTLLDVELTDEQRRLFGEWILGGSP